MGRYLSHLEASSGIEPDLSLKKEALRGKVAYSLKSTQWMYADPYSRIKAEVPAGMHLRALAQVLNNGIIDIWEGSMATIGDVLDEFFSPFSQERLWIMPESDEYTKIVLGWQPVISAVNQIKADAVNHCALWQTSYRTNPAWQPAKTDAPKPGAYRKFVGSPPGTDPQTCMDAFGLYVATKTARAAAGIVSPVFGVMPAVQTRNLFTCSIGSFNIYTTADQIDCAAKRATLNFWMYNNMSKRSFGRFANEPVFSACGMKSQYMWWNWVDSIEWSRGIVNTLPKTAVRRSSW